MLFQFHEAKGSKWEIKGREDKSADMRLTGTSSNRKKLADVATKGSFRFAFFCAALQFLPFFATSHALEQLSDPVCVSYLFCSLAARSAKHRSGAKLCLYLLASSQGCKD